MTLNLADSFGVEARFVFEAKDRKLAMRKILAELDAAMVNREAQFAIGVFASQECAPTSVPFHCVGENKAIVVLDDDSDLALRLAYQWARMTVRAGLAAESGDEIDIDRMSALVSEARRSLEMLSTIKRNHTTARKSIEQAASCAAELVDTVRSVLDQLDAELSAAEPEAA